MTDEEFDDIVIKIFCGAIVILLFVSCFKGVIF